MNGVMKVTFLIFVLLVSACGGGIGNVGMNANTNTSNKTNNPPSNNKFHSGSPIISKESFSASSHSLTSSTKVSGDEKEPFSPNIVLGEPSENGVYIAWNALETNIEITQYRIYRNGIEIGHVSGSQQEFYDENVLQNKVYEYGVSAGDASGNWSSVNSVKVVTLLKGSEKTATAKSFEKAKAANNPAVIPSVSSSQSLFPASTSAGQSSSAAYTATKDNIPILKTHPRTYITLDALDDRVRLCSGINANASCKPFFKSAVSDAVATAVANGQYLGVPDFLQYRATNDINYLNRSITAAQQFIDKAFAATGNPLDMDNLLSIDMVWDYLTKDYKLKFLEAIQKNHYFQYNSHKVGRTTVIGYHSAYTMHLQVAAALILWDDPILKEAVVTANPTKYSQWNPEDFIYGVQYQATAGEWVKMENYLAGSSPLNTAISEGAKGGLYDHFGYDNAEESCSVLINLQLKNSTGQNSYLNNLRDANKGYFWQALRLPNTSKQINLWSYGEINRMRNSFILANLYQDPRLKYFAKAMIDGPDYAYSKIHAILYYDFANTIPIEGPESLPTSLYFNGGGFVMSRSDWSNSAAYGLFISGEHFSRRYDDINSFMIHRKSAITGIAGARIRFNDINERHHFFAKLSASKNTLKVCDPNETIDYTREHMPMALGTGKKIDPSDNFCGQIPDGFTLMAADKTQTGSKSQLDINNLQNMGDITRYEHLPEKYTYAVGDGKYHYSSKVKKFERSFVHLYPADYIIFDRVETAKPEFRTSVLLHTYDALTSKRVADKVGEGVQEWKNENEFVMDNGLDKALFQVLLPIDKTTKVRGGTTYLLNNALLSAGGMTNINYVLTTPRFLEFSGYNPADYSTLKNTQVIIKGDSLTQNNDSEIITFTGDSKEKFLAFSGFQGVRTNTSLTAADAQTVWKTNQWVGWLTAKTATTFTPVSANTEKTLTADFSGAKFWQLQLFKYHANTTKQWKRIESIAVSQNLAGVDLGFSHYFDAENVNGDTFTFMPNTDAKADFYRKPMYAPINDNFGTHSLEVFDDAITTKHNFLSLVRLGDPADNIEVGSLLRGDKFVGVIIGAQAVMFAKDEIFSDGEAKVYLNSSLVRSILIADLVPSKAYYVSKQNGVFYINTFGVGELKIASNQGTLLF